MAGEDSYELVTGRDIPAGRGWATEIRKRLKGCHAIVVDLSNYNKDVLFEAGLGAGYGLPMIPIVDVRVDHIATLPSWLRLVQVGQYASTEGKLSLLSDIVEAARDRRRSGLVWPRPRKASSRRVVAIGVMTSDQISLLERSAAEAELQLAVKVLSESYEIEADIGEILELATTGGLVMLYFSGSTVDWLLNFVLGFILARPGTGGSQRAINCVGPDDNILGEWVAGAALDVRAVRRRGPAEGRLKSDLSSFVRSRTAEAGR